jgi:hypothetical protein
VALQAACTGRLRSCARLTARGKRLPPPPQFATALTNLAELDISGCSAVTLANVLDFPALRALRFDGCDSLSAAHLAATLESLSWWVPAPDAREGGRGGALRPRCCASCALFSLAAHLLPPPPHHPPCSLEELSLDGCSSLHLLALDLPRLQELSLAGCRGLTELQLRCRNLRELRLNPPGVSSSFLWKVHF